MPRCLPNPGATPLPGCIGLGFELIDQLIELVEIDPGPEPEGMRNSFRCGALTRLRLLAETGAQRPVDHVLERQTELAGASLQEPGQIIIDGECGAHGKASWLRTILMSRHQILVSSRAIGDLRHDSQLGSR
jgi:hypothetical protein